MINVHSPFLPSYSPPPCHFSHTPTNSGWKRTAFLREPFSSRGHISLRTRCEEICRYRCFKRGKGLSFIELLCLPCDFASMQPTPMRAIARRLRVIVCAHVAVFDLSSRTQLRKSTSSMKEKRTSANWFSFDVTFLAVSFHLNSQRWDFWIFVYSFMFLEIMLKRFVCHIVGPMYNWWIFFYKSLHLECINFLTFPHF